MRLAVIPARGGSKRIPGKNIKLFAGKPMIAYAIMSAQKSNLFDRIIVSTDDREIAKIAIKWGAEVPFIRSSILADDETTTVPVIVDAIDECVKLGWDIDWVCCIYPCVPFVQIKDLEDSFNKLKRSEADYCFPIAEFPSAIQRALKLENENCISSMNPEYELSRTQDLEPFYFDAGQFYWGSTRAWKTNSRISSSGIGHVIPSYRVVDIDTKDDWYRAECMYLGLSDKI